MVPVTSRTRPGAANLRLELLEDRAVPAVITVTTLVDTVAVDGAVSLREAIRSVNAQIDINADVTAVGAYGTSDTINFTGLSGTINLTSDLDTITIAVLIDGRTGAGFAGAPVLTVSGGRQFTPFTSIGPNVAIRNLAIVGSSANGVLITGTSATGAAILGNYIGLNADGTLPTGNRNAVAGVSIRAGATGAIIGGTTADTRNVISGNASSSGVFLADSGTSNNHVLGNYIGTDPTGTVKIENAIGVHINANASNNTIGGTTAAARNVISGASTNVLINQGASGNTVQGNYIGTDVTGAARIGGAEGVLIASGASQNVIGGTAAGAANLITFNRTGVQITTGFNAAAPLNNAVQGNSIFSNDKLGIDIGSSGVTANDNLDADTGPNGLQNYPVISSVVANQVFARLNSTPSTTFRIEFFASDARDPSGFGEGKTFLGTMDVITDASGNASFAFNAPGPMGTFVSATATNLTTNETSEFSNAVLGIPAPPIIPPLTPLQPPKVPPQLPQAVPVPNTPVVPPGVTPTVTAGNLAPTAGARAALGVKAVFAAAQGAGGNGVVRVFNADGSVRAEASVFPGFAGGVRIGTADINGDGVPDGIAGAGPGAPGGHVKAFSGVDGSIIRSFFAFDGFTGGVFVTGGDLNADGFAEIIVGAGSGSSHVKVFDGATGTLLSSFFAFPGFLGGVTVGASDFNNDGIADIVIGSGPGAGPHVKVVEGTSITRTNPDGSIADAALLASFLAFQPGFAGGVFVTADADFDRDGIPDIAIGAGAGAGPHVKVVSGARLTATDTSGRISDAALLASFFAFDQAFRGGVRVGEADTNGNGQDELVIAAGAGADPDVRILDGTNFADVRRFDAFATNFTGGVFVD